MTTPMTDGGRVATIEELRTRWEARRAEGARLRALVPLEAIADDVLATLHELAQTAPGETLSREEAAAVMEVHPDSISRLLRKGRLRNVGTPSRPRFLRSELPKRAAHPKRGERRGLAVVRGAAASSADTIARDAIASRMDRPESA